MKDKDKNAAKKKHELQEIIAEVIIRHSGIINIRETMLRRIGDMMEDKLQAALKDVNTSEQEDQLETLTKEKEELEKKVEELMQARSELLKGLESSKQLLDDDQEKLKKLTAENEELKGIIASLNNDIAGRNNEITTLTAENGKLNDTVASLNNDIAGKNNEITTLTAENGKLNDTIASLNNDIAGKNNDINALTAENGKLNDTVASLNNDIAGKNNDINALTAENGKLNDTIASLNNDIAGKNNDINALTAENGKLNDTIASLNNDIADKTGEINALSSENDRLNGTVSMHDGCRQEFERETAPYTEIFMLINKCPSLDMLRDDLIGFAADHELTITEKITLTNVFSDNTYFAEKVHEYLKEYKKTEPAALTEDEIALFRRMNDHYKAVYSLDHDILDISIYDRIASGETVYFSLKEMQLNGRPNKTDIFNVHALCVPMLWSINREMKQQAVILGE